MNYDRSIVMPKKQLEQLTNLCRKSKVEISGVLETGTIDDRVYISGIKLDDGLAKEQTSKMITYDLTKLISKIGSDLLYSSEDYYISFHTHPGLLSVCVPSNEDVNFMIARQGFLNRYLNGMKKANVSRFNSRDYILYIECIIDRNNIAFWYYDERTKEIKSMRVMVDGKEYKAPYYRGDRKILELFKDAYNEGKQEARRTK